MTEEDLRLKLAWLCGGLGVRATAEELKTLPEAFQTRVLNRASMVGLMLDNPPAARAEEVQHGW